MDTNDLIRNINAYPPEELVAYEGRYIAWSEDGKQILAHAASWEDLFQEVNRKGIARYVIDSIPPSEEVSLGGVVD